MVLLRLRVHPRWLKSGAAAEGVRPTDRAQGVLAEDRPADSEPPGEDSRLARVSGRLQAHGGG